MTKIELFHPEQGPKLPQGLEGRSTAFFRCKGTPILIAIEKQRTGNNGETVIEGHTVVYRAEGVPVIATFAPDTQKWEIAYP